FVNLVLTVAAFQRLGGIREAEPIPRFREILLQREARATTDKIAVITMRGLISSSLPGAVTDSMVDDMRAALQQARDDSRVKAIVLEVDSPGGEVTASDAIYSALVKLRARKPVVVYMDSLAASEHKLIDGLGELEDAFAKARELGNAPDAKVVKYGPPFSLSRFFRIFGETNSKIELTLPKQLIPQLESGHAYFLPGYYAP